MNEMPEFLMMQFGLKLQLTPLNLCALLALGLCMAVAWAWFRGRTR